MGATEAATIVTLATNYARIRAVVAPLSIMGFVAQSVSRRHVQYSTSSKLYSLCATDIFSICYIALRLFRSRAPLQALR